MTEIKRTALKWELAGMVFISVVGSALHFVFAWASCWRPLAAIAPVNESVWEHFKLSFWPGLLFAAIEAPFLRRSVRNFWSSKAIGLIVMPAIIGVGFYGYVAIFGKSMLVANLVLFGVAVVVGQLLSYRIMIAEESRRWLKLAVLLALIVTSIAFLLFSYMPPRIFLFEDPLVHDYGILEVCGE